jgi:predicted O-methyltransferase YrrM
VIIDDIYQVELDRPSDMQGHLPTLRDLAHGCSLVVELGVRDGVSTVALLAGRPKALLSIDIIPPSARLARLVDAAAQANVDWEYRRGDSLMIDLPADIDLLLIDTLHTHDQLEGELLRHAGRVRPGGRIVMHDTVTFGLIDEPVYSHASPLIRISQPSGTMGLRSAIHSFLRNNEDWQIEAEYEECHGLTVMRRGES